MEMCAEQMSKNMKERGASIPEENDCIFNFHQRILRQNLRLSLAKVELILGRCSTLALLSYEKVDKNFKIYNPNLLKFLHRGSKRLSKGCREPVKKLSLDIDIEEDIDTDSAKSVFNTSEQEIGIKENTDVCLQPNHVQDFENLFKTKDVDRIEDLLNTTLGKNNFNRGYYGKVISRFGSAEDFRLWLVNLTNQPNTRDPDGGLKISYVKVIILREIGVM
jgi:hypothetical protein